MQINIKSNMAETPSTISFIVIIPVKLDCLTVKILLETFRLDLYGMRKLKRILIQLN